MNLFKVFSCILFVSLLNSSCGEDKSISQIKSNRFSSYEDARSTIIRAFNSNKPRIADMIKAVRPRSVSTNHPDEAFIRQNCGPASYALQDILLDLGIYTEFRVNSIQYPGHQYLLLRAKTWRGEVKIIIDPTYRQFFTGTVRNKLGSIPSDLEIFEEMSRSRLDDLFISRFEDLESNLRIVQRKIGYRGSSLRGRYESSRTIDDSSRGVQQFPTKSIFQLSRNSGLQRRLINRNY